MNQETGLQLCSRLISIQRVRIATAGDSLRRLATQKQGIERKDLSIAARPGVTTSRDCSASGEAFSVAVELHRASADGEVRCRL